MATYEFRCADCGARMEVDEGARTLLVAEGCAVCGAVPGVASFSPVDPGGDP